MRWLQAKTLKISYTPSFPATLSFLCHTVESGYQAHAPIGATVKRYALHNKLRLIARIKVRHSPYDIIAVRRALHLHPGVEGRNG